MALNLDTNVGVNTAEFDAKIKASAEKAKKNLSDISKGLRVAGPEISGFGERLKNLSSVGFAGVMTAGIGILIVGLRKATEMANEMFKGAIEDAKAINEDLNSAMDRQNKRTDDLEQALKVVQKAKYHGINGAEEAQTVREAIDVLERRFGKFGMNVAQHGSQFVFSGLGNPQEETLETAISADRVAVLDAKIKSLQNIQNQIQKHEQELRDGFWNNVMSPLETQKELVRLAQERTKLSEQIIKLAEEQKKVQLNAAHVPARVAARNYDENTRLIRENAKITIKDLEEQKKGIQFGDRQQSQIFTNELTRRGGFQTGGMVWDNSRFQGQVISQFQSAVSQLQQIQQKIDQLKTI